MQNWYELGKEYIWHPYASQSNYQALQVKEAYGSKLFLEDGRELIDGISSWWTVAFGHRNKEIISAIKEQADTLPHHMFAGLASESSYMLASKISQITPVGLDKVFFVESGSVSVEVALKIAIQYWINKDYKGKNKFIHFQNGYHGDTLATMAISDMSSLHGEVFADYVPKNFLFELPSNEEKFNKFEEDIKKIKNQVAAVILEPLLQGAGGMKIHSSKILKFIYDTCKKNDILFIADEIAVSMGRIGELFACNESGITPDILCFGKALTGGTLPLFSTVTTKDIFDSFVDYPLMHGTTFMANPIAAKAALKAIEIFERDDYLRKGKILEEKLEKSLLDITKLDIFKAINVKGPTAIINLNITEIDIANLRKIIFKYGIWLRPIKDVVYLMPPLNILDVDLYKLTEATKELLFDYNKAKIVANEKVLAKNCF